MDVRGYHEIELLVYHSLLAIRLPSLRQLAYVFGLDREGLRDTSLLDFKGLWDEDRRLLFSGVRWDSYLNILFSVDHAVPSLVDVATSSHGDLLSQDALGILQMQEALVHQLSGFDQNDRMAEECQVEACPVQWDTHSDAKGVHVQVVDQHVFIFEPAFQSFDI